MIHTTAEKGLSLYDRKSPRHNWQIICSDCATMERARFLSEYYRKQAATTAGWEQYQQMLVEMHFKDGIVYSNLPRNYKPESPNVEIWLEEES